MDTHLPLLQSDFFNGIDLLKLNQFLNTFKDSLKAYIRGIVEEAIKEERNTIDITKEQKSDCYISAKEVQQLLDISAATLWRWVEKGNVTKYEIFGVPRYKKEEILSLPVAYESKSF